ncbi:MAG: adenosylcobinamide-GDP ribazoletransferase [Selenomonadaceae bacterium]|nr:adenosylcobinamide-GDP ribazoletransferase [Selenomonadaceae bacterium]
MRSFLIGLQFLTRISIVRQENWTEEDFGKSVRWFPLIGAVLGLCYGAAAAVMFLLLPTFGIELPVHVSTALLLLLTILLTGGLFCDGFMDSMDGIFSGRSKERMLEIMKDSRIGANGVMSFTGLMLMEWAVLLDMGKELLPMALFVMPIISRLMVVMAITCFPYARPQGMGRAFAAYAGKGSLAFATICTLILVLPWGKEAAAALLAGGVFALCFNRYATRILGGVTGDTYGAVATLTELVVLLTVLIMEKIPWPMV